MLDFVYPERAGRGFDRSGWEAGLIQTQHAALMQAKSGFSVDPINLDKDTGRSSFVPMNAPPCLGGQRVPNRCKFYEPRALYRTRQQEQASDTRLLSGGIAQLFATNSKP